MSRVCRGRRQTCEAANRGHAVMIRSRDARRRRAVGAQSLHPADRGLRREHPAQAAGGCAAGELSCRVRRWPTACQDHGPCSRRHALELCTYVGQRHSRWVTRPSISNAGTDLNMYPTLTPVGGCLRRPTALVSETPAVPCSRPTTRWVMYVRWTKAQPLELPGPSISTPYRSQRVTLSRLWAGHAPDPAQSGPRL